MVEMLSPGVFVTEVDASNIAPTVSNSICVYAGNFDKGVVDEFKLITSVNDLEYFYGLPTNTNYNQWYQAYNFLQYGNKLLLSRACNVKGTSTAISGCVFLSAGLDGKTVNVSNASDLVVGSFITFEEHKEFFEIVSKNTVDNSVVLDRDIEFIEDLEENHVIEYYVASMNGFAEVVDSSLTNPIVVGEKNYNVPNNVYAEKHELLKTYTTITNYSNYESLESSIAFLNPEDSKIKIVARNPGAWSSDIKICIATPESFEANSSDPEFESRYAFEGISLDDLFEYAPVGSEIGFIVSYGGAIKETFTVDFDPSAKNHNNKSTYIENVINSQSAFVYVKDNTSNKNSIADYTLRYNSETQEYYGKTIEMLYASDSEIQQDDLMDAYEIFDNKEELDIDIIIGNEIDGGLSAKNLVEVRKDCIAFLGANYSDVVNKKAADAVLNLVNWRKTGAINYDSSYVAVVGNYKYQYDRYNDKYRWVNLAGDMGGLRAQTNMNSATWFASAGIDKGQIKNVTKLAFNPKQAQRDFLYKNSINPAVSFSGMGIVVYGQRTLQSKASSFDRINVRGLFNTIERSLAKMAKYQVMEQNDTFTRNRIISMIKPYLSSVKGGRGITDFLVICDETNNTADTISRNQLIVDVYIKPVYVAEFVHLKFTNAGTNSFAEIIG